MHSFAKMLLASELHARQANPLQSNNAAIDTHLATVAIAMPNIFPRLSSSFSGPPASSLPVPASVPRPGARTSFTAVFTFDSSRSSNPS